jgi:hypothetical protein
MINIVVVLCGLLFCVACDTTEPAPPISVDTTVHAHENIRPDSTEGWVYYSCEADSIIPQQSAIGSAWDIRMPYIQCCGKTKSIPVQLNSGPNGSGNVQGAVVTARFENVSSVPPGTSLRADDAANPVVPLPVLGSNIFFLYDIASHTLRPSPDKVLIVKTSSGKVYKFQITSIYKDADPNPNQESPIGFYHFRSAQIAQ